MAEEFQIRAATLADAESIFALVHLNRDQLVPRSMGDIVGNIDRFVVATSGRDIVGCATYQVHPEIGQPEAAVVEAIASKVAPFHPKEVLVLTFAPEFFTALGFHEIPKTKVMHKLYTGCINCTKHADPFTCPEIAMVRPG